MAVAKRQGRQKPAKIEQRKVEQHSWLSPICIGQDQGEVKKTFKRRSQGAGSFSLLPPSLPHCGALLSSCFWVETPSRLEDGFSYYLNKIER